MSADLLAIDRFLVFTLVAARVSTLVLVAPLFGPAAVPVRVRALLALALSLLVAPLEMDKGMPLPGTLPAYLVAVGGEALVGLTLGLGVLVLLSAMQVAGQIISQMSGLQLAEVIDPGFDGNVPVVSQLLFYVAMAVFVIIGGHRRVMEALLDSFAWLPAGQAASPRSMVEAMTSLLSESFVLGVRAAAPVMVALLLATLILGLLSRTLPQLNVMALGFGIGAMVAIAGLSVTLSTAAWIFEGQLEPTLETVLTALKVK